MIRIKPHLQELKVLFKIILTSLKWSLIEYSELPSEKLQIQASCINQLLSITHEIYQSFDDSLEVRAVFLDTSKAFDKVWQRSFFFLSRFSFTDIHVTNHRTAGEGGGHFFNSYYHAQPLHRHLGISRTITAENSTLHIANNRTRTGNLWFPSASR